AQRALPRIRHTSGPSVAPLAKGQLQLVERGRYSNAPPPAWLDELLAAQSSIIAARPREGQSPGGPSFQQATVSRADMLAAAQVTDLPGSDSLLPPPQLPPATAAAMHAPSPESPGTTSTAPCPRCGALNFDFVMRCVNCHLQLIQICPVCDKLNRSSATSCEFCGSMLNQ